MKEKKKKKKKKVPLFPNKTITGFQAQSLGSFGEEQKNA